MPCYNPITGYYGKDVGPSGKRRLTFNRQAAFSPVPVRLPCGQCIGCRLERSRQWAMRCMHEKRLHVNSEFLTLTYDDGNLPMYGTLVKRDLQLFNKRLRKAVGSFRFYACGEYGDQSSRPHYHSICFGLSLPDKRYYKRAGKGDNLYTSKLLEEIWGKGLCVVGEVTFESCAYVARYIVDKITGDRSAEHYRRQLPDGSYVVIAPEFNLMSRKPGIGSGYFDKYGREVYQHDSVIVNGKEVRPPRFYDTRMEKKDAKLIAVLKKVRRRKAMEHREDNTPERRRVRARVALETLNQKKRSV